MRAGRLRDKVDIQSQSSTQDPFGDPVHTWTNTATRRCDIQPINGREYFSAQGENIAVTHRVRFRFEKGLLSTAKRLVNNSVSPAEVYDIESVINEEKRGRELICMVIQRG